ncbi:MAG TPA: hypothetical protein DIT32_03595 [Peptococcaceae bacterium]|nr:hypothetical protein [Peptococcaceae bacterium]
MSLDFSDIGQQMRNINSNISKANSILYQPLPNPSNAESQFNNLKEQITKFERYLDDQSEPMMMIAAFGQNILMQVTNISFKNPCLIYYYGFVNGERAQLIQHINQINFLLTMAPKADPESRPRRIGFEPPNGD